MSGGDPPRETRPCVVCGDPSEPGAAYVVGDDGPVHARHNPDGELVDLYPPERPDTFPGGP